MLKKIGAVMAAAVLAFLPMAGTAYADDEFYTKCTGPLTGDWEGTARVCMKLYYNDQGSSVVLKRVEFYVPNARPNYANEGFKAEEWYVKCVSIVSGQTLVTWASGGVPSINTDSDNDVVVRNPDNVQCNEQGVRMTGVGILKQTAFADPKDEFGSNLLIPWD